MIASVFDYEYEKNFLNFGLILIAVFGYEDTAEKNAVIERFNKQNASVQACVKTLGEGVYSNKSLSWKLDNCNASK